jgi:hypothetical protein
MICERNSISRKSNSSGLAAAGNGGLKNAGRYGSLLSNRSLVFHGIHLDIFRLKSIFNNGILSAVAAQNSKIDLARGNKGYNLDDSISVAVSPAIHNTYTFGAFLCYIKCGISFVVNNANAFKAQTGSARDSGIIDEAYIKDRVDVSKIIGVMVPKEMISTTLGRLNFLGSEGSAMIDSKCYTILDFLEKECGLGSDKVKVEIEGLLKRKNEIDLMKSNYMEGYKQLDDIVSQINQLLQGYFEQAYMKKLGKAKVTLGDVLLLYLPNEMPVYDSDGFQLSLAR